MGSLHDVSTTFTGLHHVCAYLSNIKFKILMKVWIFTNHKLHLERQFL